MARRRVRSLLAVAAVAMAAFFGWRYLAEPQHRVLALDAETGSVLWSTVLSEGPAMVGAMTAGAGGVFIRIGEPAVDEAFRPSVKAVDAASGMALWTYRPTDDRPLAWMPWLIEPPMVIDDMLLFNSDTADNATATLTALDIATGGVRWTYAPMMWMYGESRHPSIAAVEDEVFVLAEEHPGRRQDDQVSIAIRALDAGTGDYRRSVAGGMPRGDLRSQVVNAPFLVANHETVVLSGTPGVVAFDRLTGTPLHQPDQQWNQLWLSQGLLYADRTSTLAAFNVADGAPVWSRAIAGTGVPLLGRYRVSENALFALVYDSLSNAGSLLAMSAADGQERWRVPLDTETGILIFQMPAISPQAIFVLTAPVERTEADRRVLIAFARDDGRELWRVDVQSTVRTSPVTDGRRVFVHDERSRWRAWLVVWGFAGR